MRECGPAPRCLERHEVHAATFRVMSVTNGHDGRADDREIPELAALADGSLEPERRAALEARVAASPELADRLAEQQRAVALARSAIEAVGAPASLRAQIERGRRTARAPVPHR